jgi:hypothetical protein
MGESLIMNKLLNNLSIRTRMLLSVALFLATLLFSMISAYNSIGANIVFAERKRRAIFIRGRLRRFFTAQGNYASRRPRLAQGMRAPRP